jgi:hypothetical protein
MCSPLVGVYFADPERLMNDLLIVEYWNKRQAERFPVLYNHLLLGGYFNMPSARMGCEGEIGAGFSYVPPYRNYNLRCQIMDRVELSGNYRIFIGVDDPVLSAHGFGDLSDKGANVKLAILLPEDSHYKLPGIAVGLEDFLGTRSFKAQYIVATQVFLNYDMEVSLGYGGQRIKGFFGGLTWMPFNRYEKSFLNGIALVAEYDATDYKNPSIEKHPKGRVKKSPINWGLKYQLGDLCNLSVAYVRGDAIACSASASYNFGQTTGFLPKCSDVLPYRAPTITQALGPLRPQDSVAQDLIYAMQEQGFDVLNISLTYDDDCNDVLYIVIENISYRNESIIRDRLDHLLAYLTPSNIDKVTVVMQIEGFPIQEYHYSAENLRRYAEKEIGSYELQILSPLCEYEPLDPCMTTIVFEKQRELFNFELLPNTHSLFGGAKGKFKYALGVTLGLNGFLPKNIYYSIRLGYLPFSNLQDVSNVDRLNPSQIINVRSDIVAYYKQKSVTIDEAYLQKMWNCGHGFYNRCALGWFEQEYGGVAIDFLYMPINSPWAIGIEGAVVKKRQHTGLGFTNKIRKLDGFRPTYRKFLGSQYFLNLYYDLKCASLAFKISGGKFLANDYGVRYEITKYFPSGLEITLWYTQTNGHDRINGQTYYDKGVAFSLPLDIFYTHSQRNRWGYGMSAWLRDVGVKAYTGSDIYNMIQADRE